MSHHSDNVHSARASSSCRKLTEVKGGRSCPSFSSVPTSDLPAVQIVSAYLPRIQKLRISRCSRSSEYTWRNTSSWPAVAGRGCKHTRSAQASQSHSQNDSSRNSKQRVCTAGDATYMILLLGSRQAHAAHILEELDLLCWRARVQILRAAIDDPSRASGVAGLEKEAAGRHSPAAVLCLLLQRLGPLPELTCEDAGHPRDLLFLPLRKHLAHLVRWTAFVRCLQYCFCEV